MSALIQFFYEEVSFKLDREQEICDWIQEAITEEKLKAGVINIIFCNDKYLLDLNQRFLDRNTLTDVIAFDYSENDNEVSGDIFISIDRITDNASKFGQTTEKELLRVIIHGSLQRGGDDDQNNDDKSLMTRKEDNYLSLLPI